MTLFNPFNNPWVGVIILTLEMRKRGLDRLTLPGPLLDCEFCVGRHCIMYLKHLTQCVAHLKHMMFELINEWRVLGWAFPTLPLSHYAKCRGLTCHLNLKPFPNTSPAPMLLTSTRRISLARSLMSCTVRTVSGISSSCSGRACQTKSMRTDPHVNEQVIFDKGSKVIQEKGW